MRRHRFITLALVAISSTATLSAGALSAQAATGHTVSVTTRADSVGVPVAAQLSGATPLATETVIATDGHSTQRLLVQTDTVGDGAFTWIPTSRGTWTVALSNGSTGDRGSTSVFVASARTSTILTAPAVASVNTKVLLRIDVVGAGGSTVVPAGDVVVYVNGRVIGRPRILAGSSPAHVLFAVRAAAAPGQATITAAYIPKGNGVDQDIDCRPSCVSAPVVVQVVKAAIPGSVLVPSLAVAGGRVPLSAITEPGQRVTFTAAGRRVGSAIADNDGVATVAWTPAATGATSVSAATVGTKPLTLRSATITATPASAVDYLVVDPAGARAAWSPLSTTAVPARVSLNLTTTAASTGPVALSLGKGPCALSGTTLTTGKAGSTCVVTARSRGGYGYSAAEQTYVIAAVGKG